MSVDNDLSIFNGPKVDFASEKTVLDLFLNQVSLTPEGIALVFKEEEISFKELNELSNKVANYLNLQGVGENDFVGVFIDRSIEMIISVLGVLKSGAAYVPIDVNYPLSRIDYILKDSSINILITNESGKEIIRDNSSVTSLVLNASWFSQPDLNSKTPDIMPKSDQLAYVIYTSGSTGKPKGVMNEHGRLLGYLNSSSKYITNSTNTSGCFAHLSLSFDASITEVFLPLIYGKRLILSAKSGLSVFEDSNLLKYAPYDFIKLTPSHITLLTSVIESKNYHEVLTAKFIIGGEALYNHHINQFKALNIDAVVVNEYGPTEATVGCCINEFSILKSEYLNESISIGLPIANTQIYLVDSDKKLLPKGEVGEICIGGNGLARGYLNREILTREKFISSPFGLNERIYCTGDLGRCLPSGDIEFLGRLDDQVKINGHRIELGEIEAALIAIDGIRNAAVTISTNSNNESRLIAYLQSFENDGDIGVFRNKLKELLPAFMIPSFFMWVSEFPITTNGKIDKKQLPQPEYVRPDSAPLFKKPRTKSEKDIALIWSKQLQLESIGIDDNFFEMGGTSLLTQKVAVLMGQHFNLKLPVTKIYQHPTISEISAYIKNDGKNEAFIDYSKAKKNKSSKDIAIIGMAGRFPGADSIDALWEVLKSGIETTSFFTAEELDKSISETLRSDPLYVKARGVVTSVKEFDAKFFGLNPKLAEAMDPQQRLLLEIAWEALEQSGHIPKHYKGSIGVYAGTGTNTYYKNNILPNDGLISKVGLLQANSVNEKDYVASRIAYHLNLKGPAVSVHSACSTSLLAIAEAADAIRNGRCDVALAGGSSITAPINSGHLYQEGSMLSPDGHCRSFDENGKGTVFSDGAGVVLLKSLEDAIADGDIVYGVIKGVGVNNDGGNKGSFTAPSTEGQAGAISNALLDAGIAPSEISYIEAHGTATPIGDPIEIEGLKMAFGKQAFNGYCAIGSIKSNMGHLTAAAGVAGVIKTILALRYKQIPASLGFEKPNPSIDFENSPFYVNNKLTPWESNGLRKAGISSFGVGGTNVHIVVEEYHNEQKTSSASRPLQLLPWSAITQNSLEGYQSKLGNYLKLNSNFSLADVAHSLVNTRDSFANRGFVIAESINKATNKLLSEENKNIKTNLLKIIPSELAFLFPGQGAQFLQMGKSLYEEEQVFKDSVDKCAELLKSYLKLDIRQIIYPEENSEEAELKLKDTKYTQPALFVVEYALSQLWMSWGIKPTLLCGHSVGEFVAAHLAGIFTLEDALHLITVRGKLVSELPSGSMISVRSNIEVVKNIIPETLSVAAINSDRLIVVSGPNSEIETFSKALDAKNIANKLLLTSHAFHSTMMNPVLDTFKAEVRKIKLNVPRLPIVSTVTGDWLTDSEATSSEYWTNHLRATVNFSGAMETVLALEDPILLEVGPGRALTTLSMQKTGMKPLASLASLSFPKEKETAYHTVLNALGNLWLHGVEPNWSAFYKNQIREKLKLPSYVFDRKPCWSEPVIADKEHNGIINKISQQEYSLELLEPNNEIQPMRKITLLSKISEIIEDNSGVEIEPNSYNHSFLELGLDSLILTQMSIIFKKEFNTPITFRQLNDELGSPNLLAEYLDGILPKEAHTPKAPVVQPPKQTSFNTSTSGSGVGQISNIASNSNQNTVLGLIAQQLQLLGKQMELLQGGGVEVSSTSEVSTPQPILAPVIMPSEGLSEEEKQEHQKPFGASPKIEKKSTGVTAKQKEFLKNLISNYNTKTTKSKAYAQKHRSHMSDPRVVSGFKPETKELIYPIVVEKSAGNKLWDIDGNEYIDALNGFGSCLFGHQPDFIKKALHNQIELGFEVGPQHPLAGEVCELLCELTGHDRAALCNTGSEAVLGAMRIARTVTGRSLIVAFSRSYHGINDEVIVRGSKKLKTFPAASGILPEAVQNMLILDYGTEESLAIIKERSHEIAAVLVEPVQSRRPEFRPVEFLKEVRAITKASETILIFDEIITGFRMHLGGAQSLFGIKADLATYGKVIGGGISIGAIVGDKKCMDTLDGGFWQYGDDSFPEVGVTYFAGTFVRHPLALASTKASLLHLKEEGDGLQDQLAEKAERIALELNAFFKLKSLPLEIAFYRSLWRLNMLEDIPYSELLFVLMRQKGIHIWDGFPCYMTTAFTDDNVSLLINVFKESINELLSINVFEAKSGAITKIDKVFTKTLNQPPVEGAKLGLDEQGNPAWFIEDIKTESGFAKIEL